MSWDDEVPYNDSTWVTCDGYNVGKIKNHTWLRRNDETDAQGNKKTYWGMTQNCDMLPAIDNNFGNPFPLDEWKNKKTMQTQNWQRTDCPSLVNIAYEPKDDITESVDISYSISIPPSISIDVNHPELERQATYDLDEKLEIEYFYDDGGSTYDAYDETVTHKATTGWETDRPSSGDDIAPTYYFGRFKGRDSDLNYTKKTGTQFNMFNYYDIDDV